VKLYNIKSETTGEYVCKIGKHQSYVSSDIIDKPFRIKVLKPHAKMLIRKLQKDNPNENIIMVEDDSNFSSEQFKKL